MIEKKVKWLWSYNIEKTEQWLSKMAGEGWHLTSVNRWTRTFIFEKGESKEVIYRIQYASKTNTLPQTLQKAGWSVALSNGKWLFLVNEEQTVRLYPTRDALVKRNRTHAYVMSAIATFYVSTSMLPIMLISIISSVQTGEEVPLENLWLFILPLTGIVAIASFAIYVFRAYRRFEINEMDVAIDSIPLGKKMRKFRGAWMYQLEDTREWLEGLAKQGYELESVRASIFTFRKTDPNHIKYECMFEYKVQPSYFATHKEMGWKLKYSSNMTLLNYSIWAKHYEEEEEIPRFSYDKQEQRQSIKRAFKMNLGMSIYLILILSFSFYMNILIKDESFVAWSYGGVMRPLLFLALLYWIYKFGQILISYRKTIKALEQ
ncbi:DUF2812 domain-containing protein [Psychrobacillus sp. NEAU-3TGS]|uniref:DUF2812 domain-containing protein n=1 Tax=Psychrobacillus sp. NEAU-3TGS TaxID=2995412 RepID=UPI002497495E|nr:DUF2812 domain-containing protein [Psychrobacillus sp. NEAU-3TGS]MDI2587922.1 DUF2812 domain-containing protein [Psychrobacillus sp. NEAU-3TGS]